MNQKLRRFAVLLFTLMFAQAAADLLLWHVSGWPVARLVFVTATSGFLIVIFVEVAVASADRLSETGKDILAYPRVLLAAFLCTVAETIVIIWPLDRQAGSQQFHWTLLAAVCTAIGALFVAAAFVSAAGYLSGVYAPTYVTSYVLDMIARWVFWQRLATGFGTLRNPPTVADIENAVQRQYPSDRSRESQFPGRAVDRATGLARATELAEGLLSEYRRRGSQGRGPAAVRTEAGFVLLRRDHSELAVINYYQPALLFRALAFLPNRMPRKMWFEDRVVRVVARPWLPVGRGVDLPGDGHCWVTFGSDEGRYGVVTTRRAVDQPISKVADRARTRSSRTVISGIRRKGCDVMGIALIEVNDDPKPRLVPAPHTKKAGFGPVRLSAGSGHFEGFVTGLTECSQGGLYGPKSTDKPKRAALVSFIVFGERGHVNAKGNSGALVLDLSNMNKNGQHAPYLVYLGTMMLGPFQECYGILLEQIAYHWQINTQLKLPSQFNVINSSLGE